MNKRRLAGIARWLEKGAKEHKHVVGFDMSDGITFKEGRQDTAEKTLECGTVCCIAGAAAMFYNKPVELIKEERGRFSGIGWNIVRKEGKELLDLSEEQTRCLFYGGSTTSGGPGPSKGVDPKWAARVIRKLIATGEVDWAGTREKETK